HRSCPRGWRLLYRDRAHSRETSRRCSSPGLLHWLLPWSLMVSVLSMLAQEIDEGTSRALDVLPQAACGQLGVPLGRSLGNALVLIARARLTVRQRELQPRVAIALIV